MPQMPNEAEINFAKFDNELEPLCQKWIKKFECTYGPPPPGLPPLRAVNHTIQLINPDAQCTPRPPRCSAALFPLLREKTQRYLQAVWSVPAHRNTALALPATSES